MPNVYQKRVKNCTSYNSVYAEQWKHAYCIGNALTSTCSIFNIGITAPPSLKSLSVEASDLSTVLWLHRWKCYCGHQVRALRCLVWIRWRRSCVVVDSCTAGFSGSSSTSRCTDGSPPPASGAQLLCNTVTASIVYGFQTAVCIVSLIYCLAQGPIKCKKEVGTSAPQMCLDNMAD